MPFPEKIVKIFQSLWFIQLNKYSWASTVWEAPHQRWSPTARVSGVMLTHKSCFSLVEIVLLPFSGFSSKGRKYLIIKLKWILLYNEFVFLKILFIYFLEKGKEKEEKHPCVVASPVPPTGHLATQACALTRNWNSNPLVHRPAFNPLSHTSQGLLYNEFYKTTY